MIPRLTVSRLYLFVCVVLTIECAVADVVVDSAVLEATASGRARVIVELSLPGGFVPVGELTEERARAQTEAIAASQQSVLSELGGDDVQLIRRPQTVPFLALEIGPDALAKLRAMSELVVRILYDGTAKTNQQH